MLKTITSALVLSLAFAGSAVAADKAAAEAAIKAAKDAYAKADAEGIAWRDTKKMIGKAEKALADGEFDKAVKGAEAALFQGEAAYTQGTAQMDAGNPSYL